MTVLTKHLLGIGMKSGLLILLTMLFMQGGIASAASHSGGGNQGVAPYTLQLHGAAGIAVQAQSGTTVPVVSTNGHPVPITLNGSTYEVANQNDIQNNWLNVTVPQNLNLDLQVPNGNIEVDGDATGQMFLTGQMTLTVDSGRIELNTVVLAGTSQLQVKSGGGISWQPGGLYNNNNTTATLSVGQGDITVQFPIMTPFKFNSTPQTTASYCTVVPPDSVGMGTLNLTASTINMSCSSSGLHRSY